MRRTTRRAPKLHSVERESVPGSPYRLETSSEHCLFGSNSANHVRCLIARVRDGPHSFPSGPCIPERQFVDLPATAPSKPPGVSRRECELQATHHPGEYFAVRNVQTF